jgi:hypothetical protein
MKPALIVVLLWVAYSELALFFKTRRTRIATIDIGGGIPFAESENPGMFKRNMWSRLAGAILCVFFAMGIAVLS